MTPDQAAWVRTNAWPDWMRTMNGEYERGCFLFRMCHCEIDMCVPCSQPEPRHDRCLTLQHDGRPLGWDMAIYAWTRGRKAIHGRRVATVTIAGRSCRWTCPCGCWRPVRPREWSGRRPARVSTAQLDLFGAIA